MKCGELSLANSSNQMAIHIYTKLLSKYQSNKDDLVSRDTIAKWKSNLAVAFQHLGKWSLCKQEALEVLSLLQVSLPHGGWKTLAQTMKEGWLLKFQKMAKSDSRMVDITKVMLCLVVSEFMLGENKLFMKYLAFKCINFGRCSPPSKELAMAYSLSSPILGKCSCVFHRISSPFKPSTR